MHEDKGWKGTEKISLKKKCKDCRFRVVHPHLSLTGMELPKWIYFLRNGTTRPTGSHQPTRYIFYLLSHPPTAPRCPSVGAGVHSSSIAGSKNLLLWQDGKNPNKWHQDTTSGSKQGCKKLQQAISSLPILSLAGSNSVVPAGESVESVVWILCPVRDGACRADSGFHCHHLYPVLPLVPLPAAALAPRTPSKQPQQCCLPRRGIRTQCSASLHRRGCSDHAAFLQQPGTTRSQQGWRGGTWVR